MKKQKKIFITIIIVIILLLLSTIAFTDSAPMQPTQSGNLIPVESNDIQLVSERIDIYLYMEYYRVEVNYTFHNTGKEQKVIMGFPNIRENENSISQPIRDFEAYDGNEEIDIFQMSADKAFYNIEEYIKIFDGESFTPHIRKDKPIVFECFETTFKEGETKHIKNKYEQSYYINYGGHSRYLSYILKSGALWKDRINYIEVYIHLDRIPENERKDQVVYDIYDTVKNEYLTEPCLGSMDEWIINVPGYYVFKDDKIEIKMIDIEPTSNIEITIPMPVLRHIKASSILNSNKRYSPYNVYDNDPTTAWVEGADGDGIGEKIEFWLDESAGDYTARIIDKIRVINGYAKDKETYNKNNRVKKLKLTAKTFFYTNEGDIYEKIEKVVELKDTMEEQYIYFNEKKYFVSSIDFEILEVYKGTEFSDTCISELQPITTYR